RFLAEHAQGKTQILEKGVEERQAALVSIGFFGLLEAAKFAARGLACLLSGHAAAEIFFFQQLQMRAELGVEGLLIARPCENRKKPFCQRLDVVHCSILA
ncbi:MAG TPA: hypothetical protein VFR42_03315, partial [Candidatus Acidoferrum sp.]|nr:hypothetical protein [Candidatus Acidoferrum sp.]